MFDLVVDTVGSPGSVETALGSIAVGGTLLLLGLDGRPLGLTAQTLVRRQLVVRGSLTYDHPEDFQASVAAISERRLTPGRIVADEYPLEDAQAAFERALRPPESHGFGSVGRREKSLTVGFSCPVS